MFGSPQNIFLLSPETEGKKDDSLSAERRGLPLATATAAITLAASLRSKNVRTINRAQEVEKQTCEKKKGVLARFPIHHHSFRHLLLTLCRWFERHIRHRKWRPRARQGRGGKELRRKTARGRFEAGGGSGARLQLRYSGEAKWRSGCSGGFGEGVEALLLSR